MIDGGLIAANTGAPFREKFSPAIQALNPIRWYKLSDASMSGVCTDSGSQKVDGTYSSTALAAPGLLPYSSDQSAACGANSGIMTASAAGLPTGNAPFTVGMLFKKFAAQGTGFTVLTWNNVTLGDNNGSSVYAYAVTPSGTPAVTYSPRAAWQEFLFVGTYDGTTNIFYLLNVPNHWYSIPFAGPPTLAGPNSLSAALLQLVSGIESQYTAAQHLFLLNYGLSQAQVQALSAAWWGQ